MIGKICVVHESIGKMRINKIIPKSTCGTASTAGTRNSLSSKYACFYLRKLLTKRSLIAKI